MIETPPSHAPTARRPTRPLNTPFSTAPPNLTHASSISLERTMSELALPSGGPGLRSLASLDISRVPEQASPPRCELLDPDRPPPLTQGPLKAPLRAFLSYFYDCSLLRFGMLLLSFLTGLVTVCGPW